MKMKSVLFPAVLVIAGACAGKPLPLEREVGEILSRSVLGKNYAGHSYVDVFNRVEKADARADAAWRSLGSEKNYDSYRKRMREKFLAAIGGLPERTPLNAKTVETLKGDGYTVEKVVFESMPGVFVTGLLYLPASPRYNKPYPACILSCGHSGIGKGPRGYRRGCVLAALSGIASFIFDPFSQGERLQEPGDRTVAAHNRIGALAALLGGNMARFRVWDAMRAIDYLQSRGDIDADAIGCMGNSGGGTVTALVAAIDPRIKAACPSCYISSIREVMASRGPQDAEQNVFGQLEFGLNHASFVLMNANAVKIHSCHSDYFPFEGTRETFRTVAATVDNCSLDKSRYGMIGVPGPHGWKESLRVSSVDWMRIWLKGEKELLRTGDSVYRSIDVGFDLARADAGFGPSEKPEDLEKCNVTADGSVTTLPGFRSIYKILKEDLDRAVRDRRAYTAAELDERVRRRSGIRRRSEIPAQVKTVAKGKRGDMTVESIAFTHVGGTILPAILITPSDMRGDAAPVLLAGDSLDRGELSSIAAAKLKEGRPVMVADTLSTGETGQSKGKFYKAENDDERVAVMLYWIGRSLVGERAEQLSVYAAYLAGRFGSKISIIGKGRLAVPAAHVYRLERDLFDSFEAVEAPLSWTDAVSTSARYPFANVVHGALLDYDWTDLVR